MDLFTVKHIKVFARLFQHTDQKLESSLRSVHFDDKKDRIHAKETLYSETLLNQT